MKIIKITTLVIFLFLSLLTNTAKAENDLPARMFFFHSNSCPHCRAEEEFIEKLKKEYPNLKVYAFEVSSDFKNLNIFRNVTEYYKMDGAIPVSIIKDSPIIGFDGEDKQLGRIIEDEVAYCSVHACNPYPVELLKLDVLEDKKDGKPTVVSEETNKTIENNKNNQPEGQILNSASQNPTLDNENKNIQLNFFGKPLKINQGSSLILTGMFLGLADGVNPCMFSVLIFLLTYLMSIGSTKKAIKAGTAFAITTFFVYFLFMLGIIHIIDVLEIAQQARYAIIIFALVAGLLMIKDFFFYGKWFSLEIPSSCKPKLESLIKKGTIPSVVLLALLAGLVELPCTSGLPLAYVSILSAKDVSPAFYLFLYNLFFILPLVLIVAGVALAWSKIEDVERWRERTKKYMRLVAGVILVFLAIALWKNWL
jgi:cytochrome c biogenesis protein CcdA/thiol-disulfide isomerase/thioredoxin